MIRVFENNDIQIIKGEEIYFKAKDVASALGYENQKDAIKYVPEEYKVRMEDLKRALNERPLQGHPHSLYLSEPGLYALIFKSRLPSAERFRKWVFEDVLPALRKEGKYSLDGPNKLVFKIENEYDLHKKVVDYLRKYYPNLILIAGLGELQDTSDKRIKSWCKGYQKGQPDLIIANCHKHYRGFCLEFKTPKGNGKLSEAQKTLLEKYENNGYKIMVAADYGEICRAIYIYCKGLRVPCSLCGRKFKTTDTLRSHLKKFHRYNGSV